MTIPEIGNALISAVLSATAVVLWYRAKRAKTQVNELCDVIAYMTLEAHKGHESSTVESCTEPGCAFAMEFVVPIRDDVGMLHGQLVMNLVEKEEVDG